MAQYARNPVQLLARRPLQAQTHQENAALNKKPAAFKASGAPLAADANKARRALGDLTNVAPAPGKQDLAKKPVIQETQQGWVPPRQIFTHVAEPTETVMDADLPDFGNMDADVSGIDAGDQGAVAMEISPYPVRSRSVVPKAKPAPPTIHLIDAADAKNPQAVAEYMMDIMQHLRDTEKIRQPAENYMGGQTDINARMREILIDWLVEVHGKFKSQQETLYLCVNYLDRFLQKMPVSRSKLQLVGCTAMLIASKYEEIYAPEVNDFVYISDKAYTKPEILAMEQTMLATLNFNLTIPTILRFAERFIKVAGGSDQMKFLVLYICELTLQQYGMLKYLPSMIASSAVYLARRIINFGIPLPAWDSSMMEHTTYNEQQVRVCAADLLHILSLDNSKYVAVRKKYQSSRFLRVATIPLPAGFTL